MKGDVPPKVGGASEKNVSIKGMFLGAIYSASNF